MDRRIETALLIGSPGSGKGTIGSLFSLIGRHYHFSMGEVLRGRSSRELDRYASKGDLVPDNLILEVWRAHLQREIAAEKFAPERDLLLLDGLPRNVAQAKQLTAEIDIAAVVLFEIAEEKAMERLLQRKVGRSDDGDVEKVKRRLAIYEEETKPVVGEYSQEIVHRIDAGQAPLVVFRDALIALTPLLKANF